MRRFDWISLAVIISLIVIGLLMIYAAGYQPDAETAFFSTQAGRQTIYALAGITILLGCQLIDWKFWSGVAYPFYAITTGLLVLVLILGSTIKGATSWFHLGGLSFQPSELFKIVLVVFFASYVAENMQTLANGGRKLIPLKIRGREVISFTLPPVETLLPLFIMLGLALAIVVFARELGLARGGVTPLSRAA